MLKKIKIIADEKIPFLKGVLEPFVNIEYLPPSRINNLTIKEADALLIRTRTKCDRNLLDHSSVKFIATATIGFDHIDGVYCEENGIKWTNAPGCNSNSVKQYMASALLTLAKNQKLNLKDMTIGIIGVGNVGSKVENVANIFGMNVLLNDPPRERVERSSKFVSLDHLVENSDIITFHVPLNKIGVDKTFHLVNSNFFDRFNNSKIFINTSRGEVVETESIKNAIKNKGITHCVLDVWENEPRIDLELLNSVNIATPHIAGYSVEGKANGTSTCVNQLNKFFELGIEYNWYPKNLPAPKQSSEITVDCNNKSFQQVIYECVNFSYDIFSDDTRLRNSVEDFEKQRAEYPARREFNYYNVRLINADDKTRSAIHDLGFNFKK